MEATSAVLSSCEGSGVPLSVSAGTSLLSVVSALSSPSTGGAVGSSGLVSIVNRLAGSVVLGQVLGSPAIALDSPAVQVFHC